MSGIVKAHGGSKLLLGQKGELVNTGLFVTDTTVGKKMPVKMAGMAYLVANTSGMVAGSPPMDGVVTDTRSGTHSTTEPDVRRTYNRGKTQPKTMGQTPFAGSKY